jgi:hypothetical protein
MLSVTYLSFKFYVTFGPKLIVKNISLSWLKLNKDSWNPILRIVQYFHENQWCEKITFLVRTIWMVTQSLPTSSPAVGCPFDIRRIGYAFVAGSCAFFLGTKSFKTPSQSHGSLIKIAPSVCPLARNNSKTADIFNSLESYSFGMFYARCMKNVNC